MQNKKVFQNQQCAHTYPFPHPLALTLFIHNSHRDTLRAEWQCVVYATQNLARRKWIHLGYKCMPNTHTCTHTPASMCSRQNMITIKTLYTWRIYIIHFGVGSSCHIRNRCRFVSLPFCFSLALSHFLNLCVCMCVCSVTVFLCSVLDQAGFVLNKYPQTTPKNTKKQKEK